MEWVRGAVINSGPESTLFVMDDVSHTPIIHKGHQLRVVTDMNRVQRWGVLIVKTEYNHFIEVIPEKKFFLLGVLVARRTHQDLDMARKAVLNDVAKV